MDYKTALNKLLKENPRLAVEAQRIFFEGSNTLDDLDHPNVTTNSYERIYKAIKAILDKQGLKV